jgi:ribosomal protein S18 acetylase RimI-like enzyme
MASPVTLRAETPADQEFLFALYSSTRAEEMKLVPWTDSQKQAFLRMQFELQSAHYHSHYPDASYQIIVSDGAPIGRLYVHRTEAQILVIDIALLPQHRRTGIGGRLLGEILSEADGARKKVAIHVERQNPALGLYTRLGFQMVEDKGVYLYMERNPQGSRGGA